MFLAFKFELTTSSFVELADALCLPRIFLVTDSDLVLDMLFVDEISTASLAFKFKFSLASTFEATMFISLLALIFIFLPAFILELFASWLLLSNLVDVFPITNVGVLSELNLSFASFRGFSFLFRSTTISFSTSLGFKIPTLLLLCSSLW